MDIGTVLLIALLVIIIVVPISVLIGYAIENRNENKNENTTIYQQYNQRNYTYQHQQSIYPQQQIYQAPKYPYHRIDILTPNERVFYNNLRTITKPNGIDILTKIRIADLVAVNQEIQRNEWGKYFSKISSKHIDFALSINMSIIMIIELDDKSHWRSDRRERDIFVNGVLNQCGYRFIRTTGSTQQIVDELKRLGFIKSNQ